MKAILFLFILTAFLAPLGAESAVFREVKGKVEYQLQGDDWAPAKVGTQIPIGTAISTGFKSSTAIEILGSVVFIKPLTRLVIDQLTRDTGGTKTSLTLLSGKVKAEVKPSSATSETTFDVKSPTATASVRGTGFEFDGENLLVNHGTVKLANQWNISRSVQGGEFSSAGAGATVSAPIPVKPADKPAITAQGGQAEVDAMFQDTSAAPAAPAASSGTGTSAPAAAAAAASAPAAPTVDMTQVIQTYGSQLILTNGVTATSTVTQQIQQAVQTAKVTVATGALTVRIQ
jgi:hypothetical protein